MDTINGVKSTSVAPLWPAMKQTKKCLMEQIYKTNSALLKLIRPTLTESQIYRIKID